MLKIDTVFGLKVKSRLILIREAMGARVRNGAITVGVQGEVGVFDIDG